MTRRWFEGWAIVGWAALAVAGVVVAVLVAGGFDEHGMGMAIRATARTSFLLFLAAFTASALARLWPRKGTRWLRQNRRYLGVSFAVSHACHAASIIGLAVITSGKSLEALDSFTVAGGLLGYAFIAVMAATSSDRTARWLGRRWGLVHTVGIYYLWVVFLFSYGGRAVFSAYYLPLALLLVLAVTLRIAAARKPQLRAKVAARGA